MTSARRIGAPDAKNRGLLLDAAEQLMLEEGYAAVTSRRLARQGGTETPAGALLLPHHGGAVPGGLPPPRRGRPRGAGASAGSRRSRCGRCGDSAPIPQFTRISMEFMALANHRKEMRAEIAYYAERFRDEQRQAVTAALQRYGVDSEDMPPVVWTVLMTSLSRFLVLEQAVGISGGHAETLELVESYLRRLEGEPQPIAGIPPAWVVHQFRSEQSTPLGPSLDTTTAPSTARSQ